MKRSARLILAALVLVTIASLTAAQLQNTTRYRRQGGMADPDALMDYCGGEWPQAREAMHDALGDSANYPKWEYPARFTNDVFTFARIEYDVDPVNHGHTFCRWAIDFPQSDLNLSYRLQQITSLKVNPNPIHLKLTDKRLYDYPFIYMVEPGRLLFSDEEVDILRKYLTNGGFLMFDDFWGEKEWDVFYHQIKRVFPDKEPQDLPMDHPIFHCVFDIKQKPQVPNYHLGQDARITGITWERDDAKESHFRAILDDKNRIMVMICHNTDFGDGWQMETADEYFFHEFSEKQAYPMGINIIFYAMTH